MPLTQSDKSHSSRTREKGWANEYQIENARRSWHSAVASKFADDLAIHSSQKTNGYLQYADDDLKSVILAEQARRDSLVSDAYTSAVVPASAEPVSDFDDIYSNETFNVSLHSLPAVLVESYAVGDERATAQADVNLYISIVDLVETDEARRNALLKDHVCPNCGAVDKTRNLVENGCSYCGSHFKIGDLYPRVFSYYLSGAVETNRNQRVARTIVKILSFLIPFLMLAALGFAFKDDLETMGMLVKSRFIVVVFLSGIVLASAIGASLFRFLDKKLFEKAKDSPARQSLTRDMEGICPGFSYDYFEGDVFSSVRKVIFSKNLSNCPVYVGKKADLGFSNVIGCYYLGGIEYEGLFVKGNSLAFVDLRIPLRIARISGGQVSLDIETYDLKVARRIENMYDPTFSFSVVTCKSCGGSFNAFSRKRCPYCGKTYDASYNAWVVVGMKRKEEDLDE